MSSDHLKRSETRNAFQQSKFFTHGTIDDCSLVCNKNAYFISLLGGAVATHSFLATRSKQSGYESIELQFDVYDPNAYRYIWISVEKDEKTFDIHSGHVVISKDGETPAVKTDHQRMIPLLQNIQEVVLQDECPDHIRQHKHAIMKFVNGHVKKTDRASRGSSSAPQ